MNRAEFTGLPLSLALGLLWDAAHEYDRDGTARKLDEAEAPKPARPPRFDSAIYRREGVTFASEYDLDGLRYWHKRSADGESDPQYGEKNAKQAKALSYWIAYREQQPDAIWTGERNRQPTTAKAPQSKPEVYPRDARPAPSPAASSGGGGGSYADADYGGDTPDDDIPFLSNVTGDPRERWWAR